MGAGSATLRSPLLMLVLPVVVLVGSAVLQREIFCFRDAGHYYYPVYEWTAGRWRAGEIPLWNPHENGGVPAIADATAGCFYPLKLLFALPLSTGVAYTIFLAMHLPLAAIGTWFVARRWWQLESGPSLIAGAAYGYGGAVLFQHCNAVFLIGAAWLPLAIGALERLLVTRNVGWIPALSTATAMMILGGDPQLAYHLIILGGIGWLAIGGIRSRRRIGAAIGELDRPNWHNRPAGALLMLVAAALLAVALAAVQFLPALEWGRSSQRAAFDRPRNIYELGKNWFANEQRPPADDRALQDDGGILGTPAAGTHLHSVYRFSHPPWRVFELVWPNCFGNLFPENHRWSSILAGESETWTPSTYLGLIPLLLALSAGSFRSNDPRVRWLSYVGCGSLGASWGGYGIGWIARQTLPQGITDGWADSVGGLYWFMVVCLPGYVYFRYPAKWLIPFALAAAMLSGIGAQRLSEIRGRLRRWLDRTAILSAGLLAVVLLIRITIVDRWSVPGGVAGSDDWLGPIDWNGATTDLARSLAHAAVTAITGSWIVRRAGSNSLCSTWLSWLTLADLVVAALPLIATAPASAIDSPPIVRSWIDAEHALASGTPAEGQLYRTYRPVSPHWLPESWSRSSSPRRLVEGLQWDHETLFPRHALRWRIGSLEASDSIASRDWSLFLEAGKKRGPRLADGSSAIAAPMLDLLAAKTALLPQGTALPFWRESARMDEWGMDVGASVNLWSNPAAFPRVRIVHRLLRLSPLSSTSIGAVRHRTEEVLFSQGEWRDFRNLAVVECEADQVGLLSEPAAATKPENSIGTEFTSARIVVDRPDCCVVEAELDAPGLLVIADTYCPGWSATLETTGQPGEKPVEILRTNRVQRGVVLPAGQHRVTFRYWPSAFVGGIGISGLSWIVLFFFHMRLLFLRCVAFQQRVRAVR